MDVKMYETHSGTKITKSRGPKKVAASFFIGEFYFCTFLPALEVASYMIGVPIMMEA